MTEVSNLVKMLLVVFKKTLQCLEIKEEVQELLETPI